MFRVLTAFTLFVALLPAAWAGDYLTNEEMRDFLESIQVPYTVESIQLEDGKAYESIVLVPELNGNVLSEEAYRVDQKLDGLKIAYSESLLAQHDVQGEFFGDINVFFTSDTFYLMQDLEDGVYSHELIHAEMNQLLNRQTYQRFLGAFESTENTLVCDVELRVADNWYLMNGYYLDEIPAQLISVINKLKKIDRDPTEMEDLKDYVDYLIDFLNCSRSVNAQALSIVVHDFAQVARETTEYTTLKIPYAGAADSRQLWLYFPKNYGHRGETELRTAAARKLEEQTASIEQMSRYSDFFLSSEAYEYETLKPRLPALIAGLEQAFADAYPERDAFLLEPRSVSQKSISRGM